MSNYVRTKDGIVYVGDLIKDEYGNYCDPKNYETDMELSYEYTIEEADSIEELIDIYVVDSKTNAFKNKILQKWNSHYILIDWSTNITYKLEDLPDYFANIRCAIFTDKGIIYIGDMNKEGGIEPR